MKFIYDMKKNNYILFSISALKFLAYAQRYSKLQKKFAKQRIENQSKLDKIIKKQIKQMLYFMSKTEIH